MLADGCFEECEKVVTSTITADCPSTEMPPPIKPTPPPPPPVKKPPPPEPQCPMDLGPDFLFPHLIVPINAAKPDEHYGTVFNGTANNDISTIFNFDVPNDLADKTCHLVFLLPEHDQLETSAYELGGDGTFEVSYLNGVATEKTTYADAPAPHDVLGTFTLTPGSATTISEREGCTAGRTVSFKMSAVGDSEVNWFQDYNPCRMSLSRSPLDITDNVLAIGIYIIYS
jgi:glucan endo-1,3-beta-D-glucosidase